MSTGVPEGFLGLDIGPKSIELNDAAIAKSKTIVWNGPMGVFEMGAFEAGTKKMMDKIVEVTAAGAISVIGGGDTATVSYFLHAVAVSPPPMTEIAPAAVTSTILSIIFLVP